MLLYYSYLSANEIQMNSVMRNVRFRVQCERDISSFHKGKISSERMVRSGKEGHEKEEAIIIRKKLSMVVSCD
jgi:hypothetical protein